MTQIARALIRVPPFPRAQPHEIVQPASPGTPDAAAQVTPAAFIAALRAARVGGSFWAAPEADLWSSTAPGTPFAADDPAALLAALAGHAPKVEADGPFASLSGAPADDSLLEALVGEHLLAGLSYHDPFTGAPTSPLALVELLAGWRALIDANRPIAAAFGFARWKQDTVDPLLWGGAPVPFLAAQRDVLDALPAEAAIAVWKARVPADFLAALEAGPWRVLEVEDGFIRSAGLGADCVPPLSIVVDDLGVHYDPARPNRLEAMLAAGGFAPDMLARARTLRDWLVREGVSKYGVGTGAALPRPGGARHHVLVVGQVEDDRSVLFGGGAVQSNLDLLRRVRTRLPDAYIVYRPHPDVEAGHRKGTIPRDELRLLADSVEPASPISALIAMVDEVHVITSLAGFEALLQARPVTTHGTPFFAGWGLTHDLAPIPARRGMSRTLDELVAAVLLAYPRYLDPVTNLPCTAEILIMRLLSGVQRQNDALVPLRRFFGWMRRPFMQFLSRR